MAKPSTQWGCIAILTLMSLTLTMAHKVKPPPRPLGLRKLQMDKNGETETNKFWASNQAHKVAAEHHPSQMDKTEAIDSGCGDRSGGDIIYGEGHGSGGTTFGFHNLFPSPVFPSGGFVPDVFSWGEGGGSVGSNTNPGMGVSCKCTQNGFPMHYVVTPVQFQPMDHAYFNKMMKRDVPNDMASSPSGGN